MQPGQPCPGTQLGNVADKQLVAEAVQLLEFLRVVNGVDPGVDALLDQLPGGLGLEMGLRGLPDRQQLAQVEAR